MNVFVALLASGKMMLPFFCWTSVTLMQHQSWKVIFLLKTLYSASPVQKFEVPEC